MNVITRYGEEKNILEVDVDEISHSFVGNLIEKTVNMTLEELESIRNKFINQIESNRHPDEIEFYGSCLVSLNCGLHMKKSDLNPQEVEIKERENLDEAYRYVQTKSSSGEKYLLHAIYREIIGNRSNDADLKQNISSFLAFCEYQAIRQYQLISVLQSSNRVDFITSSGNRKHLK